MLRLGDDLYARFQVAGESRPMTCVPARSTSRTIPRWSPAPPARCPASRRRYCRRARTRPQPAIIRQRDRSCLPGKTQCLKASGTAEVRNPATTYDLLAECVGFREISAKRIDGAILVGLLTDANRVGSCPRPTSSTTAPSCGRPLPASNR